MKTNAERREVASRLRAFGETDLGSLNRETWNLIADLIEPEPERTCRDADHMHDAIKCSECGEITLDTLYRVELGDGLMTVKEHRPRFCSNCGARVVDE